VAHAFRLCNRAEEYDYAGPSECAPASAVEQGKADRGKAAAATQTRLVYPDQTARPVSEWIGSIGLDPRLLGTHSLRRTKATLIYRRTGNLRAVQLLLGHTKIESTVRYLGIEVDDALAIAEQVDV
jgi:integrase